LTTPEVLVLPADVVLAPVAELSADLRDQLGKGSGDYYVTRPQTRTVSSVIDADTAELIGHFRRPMTIVDAVVAYCASANRDPRAILEEAFASIAALVEANMLVAADSTSAEPVAPSLKPGTFVDGAWIVQPVNILSDTEVYRARRADGLPVALKIAGPAADRRARAGIRHEADVLGNLDGRVNPSLRGSGVFDQRPYLVSDWKDGVHLNAAALEIRTLGGTEGRNGLVGLALSVLEGYSHLHAQGVLHGDVHPRNILAGPQGEVTLLDYGLAAGLAGEGSVLRGGIDLFQGPEVATARLAGDPPPRPSVAIEQYSLASLLYQLLTGGHTHAFSLEPGEMWRQVVREPALPFSSHGRTDLAAIETVIHRALAKDPSQRYASIGEMLTAFRLAADSDRVRDDKVTRPRPARLTDKSMSGSVLERLKVPGQLFTHGLAAPQASLTYGGAGLGYALLRLARTTKDAVVLSYADLWSRRAAAVVSTEAAFWSADLGIVPEVFGRSSLFHHAAGVHYVEALIAHARADEAELERAVGRFVAACATSEHIDVAFGRAGLLLGCATLLDILPPHLDPAALRSLGRSITESIWAELGLEPAIGESTRLRALGAAHGWSGVLFASLRWAESSKTDVPAELPERLDELAALAEPAGRGLRWPRNAGEPVEDLLLTASWCNGSAGHLHLWALAQRRWGDDRFGRLAEMAGWSAYEDSIGAPGNLCCGLAGRAYALLSLYRQTGDPLWLRRAETLGARAVEDSRVELARTNSLYHGEIGIALLESDLADPEFASMPLYEAEGWAVGSPEEKGEHPGDPR